MAVCVWFSRAGWLPACKMQRVKVKCADRRRTIDDCRTRSEEEEEQQQQQQQDQVLVCFDDDERDVLRTRSVIVPVLGYYQHEYHAMHAIVLSRLRCVSAKRSGRSTSYDLSGSDLVVE